MDEQARRAEQLMMLSSAARRVADLVAASPEPLRYEIMRHLLRVSEETMTEVLEETVHAKLVRRAEDPFTYVPYDEQTGNELRESLGDERLQRHREQISGATRRVFE